MCVYVYHVSESLDCLYEVPTHTAEHLVAPAHSLKTQVYTYKHKHTQSVAESSSTCVYMYMCLYTIIILHNTVYYRAGNFGELLDLAIW